MQTDSLPITAKILVGTESISVEVGPVVRGEPSNEVGVRGHPQLGKLGCDLFRGEAGSEPFSDSAACSGCRIHKARKGASNFLRFHK